MILKIVKIVYPGRSMGLDQGKVVFTDGGLPGETVEVEIVKDRKSYAEATTSRIVERAAGRVEPRCGHFAACSPYQEIDYGLQLEIKRGQVEEILTRGLRRELEIPAVVPSPDVWGYRNRIRLAVVRKDGETSFAYHEPGEEASFLPVDRCYLASDRANAVLADLSALVGREEFESVEEVEIRESRARGKLLLVLHLESGDKTDEIKAALEGLHLNHPLSGIVALVGEGDAVREVPLGGVRRLEETLGETVYHVGSRSFFQTNVGILGNVLAEMRRAVEPFRDAPIADFYCGVGTFGLHLAREVREVFGVEAAPENLAWLKKNISLNRAGNFTVCEGAAEEWLPWTVERGVGAVILDPPRRGLDPRIVGALAGNPGPRLVYLSCNPTTLVRDLKALLESYELEGLKIYDFFPHTPHIEVLAVLGAKKPVTPSR
jgi:23S rRNA (uracil1939-C5)-methyltransferase